MPMKSEPFCIVMEAPAALSTNMEVYWPACGDGKAQIMVSGCSGCSGQCLCASPTCSSSRPCTHTVNILLLLSNPTIISIELQSKRNRHKHQPKHVFSFIHFIDETDHSYEVSGKLSLRLRGHSATVQSFSVISCCDCLYQLESSQPAFKIQN